MSMIETSNRSICSERTFAACHHFPLRCIPQPIACGCTLKLLACVYDRSIIRCVLCDSFLCPIMGTIDSVIVWVVEAEIVTEFTANDKLFEEALRAGHSLLSWKEGTYSRLPCPFTLIVLSQVQLRQLDDLDSYALCREMAEVKIRR